MLYAERPKDTCLKMSPWTTNSRSARRRNFYRGSIRNSLLGARVLPVLSAHLVSGALSDRYEGVSDYVLR